MNAAAPPCGLWLEEAERPYLASVWPSARHFAPLAARTVGGATKNAQR